MKTKLLIVVMILSLSFSAEAKFSHVSGDERDFYLKRAQIWRPTDIPNMDILAGPHSPVSIPPGTAVRCDYVEVKKGLSGVQPKFLCKTASGEILRVKYGATTLEVYAEVVATRLLWALGFYADEVYPAKVICHNCPEQNTGNPEKGERRIDRIFETATIERNFPGAIVEERDDQGWKWSELDKIDEKEGGAPVSHRDALKLLMILIQHGDSKADNQRIACYQQDIVLEGRKGAYSCMKPVLMVQDLGSTFGSGMSGTKMSKMTFHDWEGKSVWNVPKEAKFVADNKTRPCFGNLTTSYLAREQYMDDPFISEEGRRFLAGLLNQLSDQQIIDLFRVAGVDKLNETIEENGIERPVTAEDWARVFKEKRAEINDSECTEVLKEK